MLTDTVDGILGRPDDHDEEDRMRQRTIMTGVAIVGVLLAGCGGSDDPAPVDIGAPGDDGDVAPDTGEEAPDSDDDAPDAEDPAPDPGSDGTEANGPGSVDPGPQPDPADVDEPCAGHEDRSDEVFIELVAPVDEQVASDEVELAGCSNVFEGTVAWTVLDGDGRTLAEGATMAECGTGCVGAFRDTVPLDAAAGEPAAYVQVFSPNVSDEGPAQQALSEVLVVLE